MRIAVILLLFTGVIVKVSAQQNLSLIWDQSPFTPYIDFANDNVTDYDIRMILANDDLLTLYGGDMMLAEGNLRLAQENKGLVFYGGGERIIGTPAYGIQFQTNNGTPRMTMLNSGEVGIGNSNPQTPVDVTGNFTLRNMNNVGHGGATLHFTSYDYNSPGPKIKSDLSWAQGTSSQCNLVLSSYWGGDKNELTLSNGNVGIGTSAITSKLTVAGDINSREIKVTVNAGSGPDYVFEPTYTLPSLDSVQLYINQNKHLPEVPSAKEMEANGVNLGEMNMLLLKKVEELTLYMIELKNINQDQSQRMNRMEEEIKVLKDKIN